ncbi:substrate-binding domain-containing protein [Leisingera aquaemixtae]|uniref:Substrate-binding domain-containing protein n=1 Tax=Leisingera aquaemixtae TaxID=1396826 RepID=A0ABY5WHD8_9RHOB|nr:substrate-binding domain-containing protein [Leisingera aquaemixtae]UWQ40887.1 substrate-binding domain-containing protein [Leisingera aquaemixtae]
MRHALFSALLTILALAAAAAAGFEVEERHWIGPEDGTPLRVISTTDTAILEPLIGSFLEDHPEAAIEYTVANSSEVMKAVLEGQKPFDVALSSAMDLQTKLANDGFTRPHRSAATALIPEWGEWRSHVFAFSLEPASIVVSAAAFSGGEALRTRQDLISLLRAQPERFRGKVGTYDVSLSGLGYLFATQDARTSETYWRLMEVIGSLDPQLFCCSSSMIESVASGEILVAYNVLGSYARARRDLADKIIVIDPEDYTHLMMRSAVLLKGGRQPGLARSFADHLAAAAWSQPPAANYPFAQPPVAFVDSASPKRPIQLGPGLLVYLDAEKRRRFMAEWFSAVRKQ